MVILNRRFRLMYFLKKSYIYVHFLINQILNGKYLILNLNQVILKSINS